MENIEEIEARGNSCLLCGCQWYIRYDADTDEIIEDGCGNPDCENFLQGKWEVKNGGVQ